jgi:hypothetical protein
VNVVLAVWLAMLAPQGSQGVAQNCYPITKSDLTRKDAPRFSMYPAKKPVMSRPAPVDLKSDPAARVYRTRLREGAAKGPNFAGHYTVVGWGCGAGCVTFAIVDSLTGKVIVPQEIPGIIGIHLNGDTDDFESEAKTGYWGLRFRLDSKLLVIVGMPNEDEDKEGAFYYLFEDGQLRPLYSVVVHKRICQ